MPGVVQCIPAMIRDEVLQVIITSRELCQV